MFRPEPATKKDLTYGFAKFKAKAPLNRKNEKDAKLRRELLMVGEHVNPKEVETRIKTLKSLTPGDLTEAK